jgi:hypothetical protein
LTNEDAMKKQAGLWIDHRETVLVLIQGDSTETKHIASDMEKHVRFSGGNRTEDGAADDQRDRRFAAHLERYYDEVIAHLGGVDSILLFGPGEAKGEFEKRLGIQGFGAHVVGVEAADKMTERQVAAKVRGYFGP